MSIPCPKGWQLMQLSDLCDFQNGYAFKNNDFYDSSADAFIVFKMGNIERGGGLKRKAKNSYFPSSKAAKLRRFILNKGDIVMSMTDMKASMALLGHTAMIDANDKYILNQRVGRITVREDSLVDKLFLYYYTNSQPFVGHLRGVAHSGVQVNLSTEEIKKSPVVLPSLDTQHCIASILSAYDDLIENNTRRIETLEEMARRLYEEWFVHFRFPGHEQVSFKETELGRIPEGWEFANLGSVAKINPDTIKPKFTPDVINYIDIASVGTGRIDKTQSMKFSDAPGRARRRVGPGDILWSCVRPNRRSHVLLVKPEVDTVASTGFAVLRAEAVPYTYLYYAVTTHRFVDYLVNRATGAAYPAVKASDFEEADLLIPLAELLCSFHDIVEPSSNLINSLEKKNTNLRAQRDLLLPKLISGEIDVSDLSMPTDTEDKAA